MSRKVRGGSRRPASRSSGGNRWIIPTVVLFVVLPIGAAVLTAVGGDSTPEIEKLRESRDGSSSLGRPATPLLPEGGPDRYAITYRITDTASDTVSRSTEDIVVRRPFDARLVVREGWTPGQGSVRARRTTTITKLGSTGGDGRWTLFFLPPALATTDVRFGAALDQALADGAVVAREQRRVGDRVCQVFRAGSSLQAGLLTPYEPGSPSFADVCVDAEGMVLEEVWSIDGKRVQRRLAIDVKTGDDVPASLVADDTFAIPADAQTVPVAQGGGSARRVDPNSRPPGAFRVLPDDHVPDGFVFTDRWAVVSPRLDILRDPTRTGEPSSTSSLVDVYVRGPDVILIDRGATTGDGKLPEAMVTQPVDLGGLGIGEAITDFRMNEVRATAGRDFVRVQGTVPIPILVEVAQALTVVEGGELVYLDD